MPKFEDHTELLDCGNCPFLKINPKGSVYFNIGGSGHRDEQQNICKVNQYYFGLPEGVNGGTGWQLLENGENPKRKSGCLLLAKHIHNQMADAFCLAEKAL